MCLNYYNYHLTHWLTLFLCQGEKSEFHLSLWDGRPNHSCEIK